MVVDKAGNKISYAFREETMGSRAPIETVMEACESVKSTKIV